MDSYNRDQSALHHISRPIQNRSDDDSSERNEKQLYVSEEEIEKRDVVMVDDSIFHVSQLQNSREQCIEQKERLLLEEMHQDEQLKELGLYEDGMSREQKKQLLEVVAASKETAREEENRRQKTKHFEKQFLYEGEERKNTSDLELKYQYDCRGDHLPNFSVICNRERNNNSNKEQQETLQSVKNHTVLLSDLDEDTQPLCSQELFHTPTFTDEIDMHYSLQNKDLSQKIVPESSTSNQQENCNSRSPTTHCIKNNNSINNEMLDDVECTTCQTSIQNTVHRKIDAWASPDSPVSISLLCPRFMPHMVEKVPFFCPLGMDPKDYTFQIVKSINEYHAQLYKLQRNSLNLHHWGDPVIVGRHHSNTLDILQRGFSAKNITDNNNDIVTRKVITDECIETTIDDDSYSLPDLEEWTPESTSIEQTNKKIEVNQKHSSSAGSSKDIVMQHLSSNKLLSKEFEKDDYTISNNKRTDDCAAECKSDDSFPAIINVHNKSISTVENIPGIQFNQSSNVVSSVKSSNIASSIKDKETVPSILVEKVLANQTEKIRILDECNSLKRNEYRTHTSVEKVNSKQVNHVTCSSSNYHSHEVDDSNSSEIIQDMSICESDIQIECLPSKRDKRSYTRTPQQRIKIGKAIKEDKQRKRKFEEELNLLQESVNSQNNDTVLPIKRKI